MTYRNYKVYQTVTLTPLQRLSLMHDFKTLISSFIKLSGSIYNMEKFFLLSQRCLLVNFSPFQHNQKLLILMLLPIKKQKNDAVMKRNQLYHGRICNPCVLMFGLYCLFKIEQINFPPRKV